MHRFLVSRQTQAQGDCVAKSTAAGEKAVELAGDCGAQQGGSSASTTGDPARLISWNVNGLVSRIHDQWSCIRAFIEREKPDLLCLQEVRLPAAGPKGCKRGDGQRRQRGEAKRETRQEKEEWQLIEKTFLAVFGKEYTFYWSLADWKYSGTAMLVRRPLRPSRVRYTLPALAACSSGTSHADKADPQWHPDGRVIVASFEEFDVLATYAPNNGNDQAAFQRRAAWDEALLKEVSSWPRPLVWIGDLNCSATEVDVTHPAWFMQQCYQGDPPEMRGQPGFTEGERRRFNEILEAGRLVDTHRRLHPASEPPPPEGPHYTWRGHPPVHMPVARYHGRGMRIDYALVAEKLWPRVQESVILGHGASRQGFMGSDHSPIRLVLGPSAAEGGEGPSGAPASLASNGGQLCQEEGAEHCRVEPACDTKVAQVACGDLNQSDAAAATSKQQQRRFAAHLSGGSLKVMPPIASPAVSVISIEDEDSQVLAAEDAPGSRVAAQPTSVVSPDPAGGVASGNMLQLGKEAEVQSPQRGVDAAERGRLEGQEVLEQHLSPKRPRNAEVQSPQRSVDAVERGRLEGQEVLGQYLSPKRPRKEPGTPLSASRQQAALSASPGKSLTDPAAAEHGEHQRVQQEAELVRRRLIQAAEAERVRGEQVNPYMQPL